MQGGKQCDEGATVYHKVRVCPLLDSPYEVEVETREGGHGGGETLRCWTIFFWRTLPMTPFPEVLTTMMVFAQFLQVLQQTNQSPVGFQLM